jgi:hypothetical protein
MPTFTQIGTAQVVGGGGAASIDFTSIPSTYTDLVVKYSLKSVTALDIIRIRFNSNSSSYTYRLLRGSGSAAASFDQSSLGNNTYGYGGYTATTAANMFGNGEVYIPNYAGSTNKSFSVDAVQEDNATTAYMALSADLWSNTAAITSITISGENYNLAQHSSAYLYGVSNA